MKVCELLEMLTAFDPDDDVTIGCEGGDHQATEVVLVDEALPSYIGVGPGEGPTLVQCRWVSIR